MAFRVMVTTAAAVFVLAAPASAAHVAPKPSNGPDMVPAFAFLYFVPIFIAMLRRHPSVRSIAAINILFGWTIIGWVAALAWSLMPTRERRDAAIAMPSQPPLPQFDPLTDPLVPITIANVISQKGEAFYWGVTAETLGEIHHQEYVRGYRGASVRVMRGVYVHGGGSRGHAVDNVTFGVVDYGTLVLSNARVMFIGSKGTSIIGYQRIVKIDPFTDGFRVHSDQGAPVTFRTGSQREAVILRRLIAGDYGDPPPAELRALS